MIKIGDSNYYNGYYVSDTMLCTWYALSHLILKRPYDKGSITVPILQMRKLRLEIVIASRSHVIIGWPEIQTRAYFVKSSS